MNYIDLELKVVQHAPGGVETLLADAKAKGAGGERLGNRGYFFPPSVLVPGIGDARSTIVSSRGAERSRT